MKKLIVGFAAAGVVVALFPAVKRRMVQEMQGHCERMAAHCKEMMGPQQRDGTEAATQETMGDRRQAPAHEETAAAGQW